MVKNEPHMALTHNFQHVAVLLKLKRDRLVPHWRQGLLLHAGGEELLVGQPHLTEWVTVTWATTTVTVADPRFELTGEGVVWGSISHFFEGCFEHVTIKNMFKMNLK